MQHFQPIAKPELPYAEELRGVLDRTHQSTNVMGAWAAIIFPAYCPWLGVGPQQSPG